VFPCSKRGHQPTVAPGVKKKYGRINQRPRAKTFIAMFRQTGERPRCFNWRRPWGCGVFFFLFVVALAFRVSLRPKKAKNNRKLITAPNPDVRGGNRFRMASVFLARPHGHFRFVAQRFRRAGDHFGGVKKLGKARMKALVEFFLPPVRRSSGHS